MKRPVVLVADDSIVVRAALQQHLGGGLFTVVEARDGEEALALAREHRPDVVLLDVVMPGKDGFEVLQALQADPELAATPVVFLTVKDAVEDVVRGLSLGGHDYLRKPFEHAELVARVTAAARTKALHDELRQRNAELEAFAVQATHDLKSPLTAIKGSALTLLHNWTELDEELRAELLHLIAGAADRANRLVSDLLTLARNGSEPVRWDAVADAETVVRVAVASRNLDRAEVRVEGEWAPVRMEGVHLASVIGNLVENADHHGRSEDGFLHLEITGSVTPEEVQVVVADRGPGLGEDAERVFEPFFRRAARSGRPSSSTGIGLTIVRRTVERWGGRITAEPSEEGASFRLVLPRSQPSPARAVAIA